MGKSKRSNWLRSLDFYSKVPTDLMEGSKEGRIVSWIALSVIATLVWHETASFLTPKLEKDLMLDSYTFSDKLHVDFNITMLDLKCDYASINLVGVLGNEQVSLSLQSAN
jgi:hypothetical protein